jgi:transposase-like protein
VRRYSDELKLTAVRLSQQSGMQVQTVAAALEIHPSCCRSDEGRARRRPGRAGGEGAATRSRARARRLRVI